LLHGVPFGLLAWWLDKVAVKNYVGQVLNWLSYGGEFHASGRASQENLGEDDHTRACLKSTVPAENSAPPIRKGPY
jgi:hypothetical protein